MNFKEITWGVVDLVYLSHNNMSIKLLLTR